MKNKKTILIVATSVGLLIGAYFIIKGVKKNKEDKNNNPIVPPSNTTKPNVITPNRTTPTNSTSNISKRAVVIDGVNIRQSPSTSSAVIRIATKGETFTILEQSGTWYRVAQGWITAKPEFVKTI